MAICSLCSIVYVLCVLTACTCSSFLHCDFATERLPCRYSWRWLFIVFFMKLWSWIVIRIAGDSEPIKIFERTTNLSNNQIINYRCDPSEKWLVLIGIAPGPPEVCLVECVLMSFTIYIWGNTVQTCNFTWYASFHISYLCSNLA